MPFEDAHGNLPMLPILSNPVTVAATILSLFAAGICQAEHSITESDVRAEFVDAIAKNPALHGVWVDLQPLKSPVENGNQFALKVIVDSRPDVAESQKNELLRMIRTVPRSFGLQDELVVIDRLPFRQFVEELKKEVEFSPEMAGAAFEDAYYFDDADEGVIVVLVGRVMNDDQTQRMTQLSNSRLRKLFGESVLAIKSSKPTGKEGERKEGKAIVQKQPLLEVASFCFDLGLQRFTSQNYEDAYASFTRAHLESPKRIDIQYWRIVSLLGNHRDADARHLLQTLVDTRPRDATVMKRDAMAICRSLEPIQGPLRWKLTELENSLIFKTRD
jgi:hypothetical protein